MAYITYQQYLDLYGTCPISEEEFPVYAGLASDMIDSITRYRIVEGGGISALPSILQTLVQKAAAAQVLYFTQIGLETVLTGQAGQSFTVGKRRIVQYNHKARRSDGQPFRAFLA